jgi:DNA-binding NtrC family response regulator
MKQSILILASSSAEAAGIKTCAGDTFSVEAVSSVPQAELALAAKVCDLLLMDAGYLTAAPQLLADALRRGRARQVVILAAPHQFERAIVAMRQGAVDVLSQPVQPEALQQLLLRCLGTAASDTQLQSWRKRYAPDFIGEDPKIISLLSMIKRIADTDCDVLITGASGTGKELIARCIHSASRRHKNPFVALNCAAIPKDLMESEIFGHSRGAFTGATERRSGKFEVAAGGTLFLDETGEMDLTMQSKFLRVIQEREVTPVGDSRTFKVDVRIVSATNQDLDTLRRDKLFREDLYYRLNVVPVHLPALAERPLDIPSLAQHFIERANRRHGRRVQGLSDSATTVFCDYAWPGNVRELQNLVERVVILKGSDGPIAPEDLPAHVTTRASFGPLSELRLPERGLDINETLALVETRLTLDALERAKGNKARAAELLGLKRTTLVERLKKLHLEEPLSRRD